MKMRVKREFNATVQYMLKLIFYKKNAKSRIFFHKVYTIFLYISGKPAPKYGGSGRIVQILWKNSWLCVILVKRGFIQIKSTIMSPQAIYA